MHPYFFNLLISTPWKTEAISLMLALLISNALDAEFSTFKKAEPGDTFETHLAAYSKALDAEFSTFKIAEPGDTFETHLAEQPSFKGTKFYDTCQTQSGEEAFKTHFAEHFFDIHEFEL